MPGEERIRRNTLLFKKLSTHIENRQKLPIVSRQAQKRPHFDDTRREAVSNQTQVDRGSSRIDEFEVRIQTDPFGLLTLFLFELQQLLPAFAVQSFETPLCAVHDLDP